MNDITMGLNLVPKGSLETKGLRQRGFTRLMSKDVDVCQTEPVAPSYVGEQRCLSLKSQNEGNRTRAGWPVWQSNWS